MTKKTIEEIADAYVEIVKQENVYRSVYFHFLSGAQAQRELLNADAKSKKAKDHPLYDTWAAMRYRCRSKSCKNYKDYGARGIDYCDEWDDFWAFVNDMGPKPTPKHSIDRIDNAKGYSKENCRWATRAQQSANRRKKAICKNGHPLNEAPILENGQGRTYRACKVCRSEASRRYHEKNK